MSQRRTTILVLGVHSRPFSGRPVWLHLRLGNRSVLGPSNMRALALLAQAARGNDLLRRPEVIWGTIGLAVALLVGALIIWLTDKWRKRNAAGEADSVAALTDFRQMYERGEITEEEYIRLRNRVAQRVKTAPSPSPEGATPPSAPPPASTDQANPPPPA